ncbi:trypsin-like peptidase domain-containing protein [Pseudochelatococcus lubricantis]|uniref:trypsin-like peptidase domain-containing protein n=1 Tax=Pseudochelatococcus lubricantis TaxID=1538102 RepID=UPI0035EF746E
MAYLTEEEIFELVALAARTGLFNQRDELLGGLEPGFLASLRTYPSPQSQILQDLRTLSRTPVIQGGVVPLFEWLRTAAALTAWRVEEPKHLMALAERVADAAEDPRKAAMDDGLRSAVEDFAEQEEKIILQNDLLPFSFLAGAVRTGKSVLHLSVPRIEGGAARSNPHTGKPIVYHGTGWLIGRRHIITNHHVINARSPGEAAAGETDFRAQAGRAVGRLDFDTPDAAGRQLDGLKLIAASVPLDYAILELPDAPGPDPLPLWSGPLTLPSDGALPLNIVQHPGGAAKQICLRNNAAYRLREPEISYFTDTDVGSSGSPVCNDLWAVVALHRASTRATGGVLYQGRKTAWINVGTRIDLLIADVREAHAGLWSAIEPAFATT